MSKDPVNGPACKSLKNMFKCRRKNKTTDQKIDKQSIDDLSRYVDAELDFYKEDWEENRANYVPSQSDYPGATPN